MGFRAACPQAAAEVGSNAKPYGSPLEGAASPTPRGGERRRKVAGGMNFSPYGLPVSGSWPEGCGGVKTPPYDAKDKGVAMAREREWVADERGEGGRQPAPLQLAGGCPGTGCNA